ncbi:hypothetical protein [Nonomuraea sp. NPDC049695]
MPWIEAEQQHWFRMMDRGQATWNDEGFQMFRQIMHVTVDPGKVIEE